MQNPCQRGPGELRRLQEGFDTFIPLEFLRALPNVHFLEEGYLDHSVEHPHWGRHGTDTGHRLLDLKATSGTGHFLDCKMTSNRRQTLGGLSPALLNSRQSLGPARIARDVKTGSKGAGLLGGRPANNKMAGPATIVPRR